MLESQPLHFCQYNEIENPLLWPVLQVLTHQPSNWKVHTLIGQLTHLGFVPTLDETPEKDVFKRNFLLMNALYQLQDMLYPDQWLQVEAMDIVLFTGSTGAHAIDPQDPLRTYYTDWQHYEASVGEVKRLLDEFWSRYRRHVGQDSNEHRLERSCALRLFELDKDASEVEIRKQWRRLALQWHPDRSNGDSERFQQLCAAWHVLR
ncbi:molecular chaperone DnaJ [Vibrio sp. 10N.286.49.B3]|uniref:DNA-J related domain-containing protein n=1 Tax=Vibrio sp. 10N.286.49.B3 TaxID=1880855 RepID=UPI000C82F06A|nr:DNA-J related domain-containing protein [Vibrio sp. 10N.286.49.B3]PMH41419.1 molecular chaperone DnaJ [Vibrio sp. 10N.286.49.B3]